MWSSSVSDQVNISSWEFFCSFYFLYYLCNLGLKISEALCIPCSNLQKEYRPNDELNVNSLELSLSTGMCEYPLDASSLVKNFGFFISTNISSAIGSL